MVTSNDAALSVPDWPTSLASLLTLPPNVGGINLDLGHRVIGEVVGLLTIILSLWIAHSDRRVWMRKLGWVAFAAVVAQGALGVLATLKFVPQSVTSVHATLAQTFFCLIVAIWLFTGRTWIQEPRQNPALKRPSIQVLTALSVTAIYVQLILGAAFRHHGIKLLPHIVCAAVVAFVVLWTVVRVLTEFPQVDQLRKPAIALLSLLMMQLGLGFAAWATRVESLGSTPAAMWVTVLHVSVGALFLATAVVLAIQAWRHVAIPTPDRIRHHEPRAVAV